MLLCTQFAQFTVCFSKTICVYSNISCQCIALLPTYIVVIYMVKIFFFFATMFLIYYLLQYFDPPLSH